MAKKDRQRANLNADPRAKAAQKAAIIRTIRSFTIVIALLVVLIIAVPRLSGRTDRSAVKVDSAVITLPPQGVDTFVFNATAEPTAAPTTATVASMSGTVLGAETTAGVAEPAPVAATDDAGANGPTAVPTVEPTPTATPEFTATPVPTDTPKPVTAGELLNSGGKFKYLPVINDVDTNKKWIAITVDDCFQVGNLQKILKCAQKNKAKLTIFPIGQNLSLSGMKKTLKAAVKQGFEIENHTWSHQRVFRMSEKDMATEIWKQDAALNKLLGMNYEEHFFRCMGGDGELDQRTHNYLKQLGYKAIAHWSYSGSDATLKQSQKHLHPGAVYLFHTTDRDTKILLKFIPWVAKKGYKMVTLNKLVGYKENKTSKYKAKKMPAPKDYTPDYRTIHKGEYSWMTVLLQNRLRKLGLLKMEGQSTGYYGDQTMKAVAAFQKANGLSVTGEADARTQKAILAS